MEKDTC